MKIHFVLTLFSAILRTSIAQGDTYLCNICGEGKMIGNIGGVVVIDGLGNRTCTDLNDLGLSVRKASARILSSFDGFSSFILLIYGMKQNAKHVSKCGTVYSRSNHTVFCKFPWIH